MSCVNVIVLEVKSVIVLMSIPMDPNQIADHIFQGISSHYIASWC
jgi:hypothetical protein